MSLSMGSLALPTMATTIAPFNSGPAAPLTSFHNLPAGNSQQLPWQQGQLSQQSLWQVLQQNKKHLETPFNFQQQQNKNLTSWFPWQKNQQGQGQNTTNSNNDEENDEDNDLSNKNETSKASEEKEDEASKEDEEKKKQEEAEEEIKELMVDFQEQFEEWIDETDEARETTFNDFQTYFILLLPYLVYNKPIAKYFAATELFSLVLTKLGINDEDNMLILLFAQCIDLVALTRGRLKLVSGYKQNWYQELYDYMLTKLGVTDVIRLGTQMFMPQSPAPDYELRR